MKKIFFLLTIFSVIFANNSAFAKHKKKRTKIEHIAISSEYVLQADLSQNECQNLIGGECFRRDHMRDKPYYHRSRVVIFGGKIFAEQFFENREKSKNMLLLKVKNGSYKIITNQKNKISFSVKNGFVSDLKMLKGDLKKEKIMQSKCDLSEATYGFYRAYAPSQILERSVFFRDEGDFEGLQEVVFFVEKSHQEEVLVLLRNTLRNLDSIKDLRICKMPNQENYLLKHFSDDECQKNRDEATMVECSNYANCEDFLVVKNCEVVLLRDAMN